MLIEVFFICYLDVRFANYTRNDLSNSKDEELEVEEDFMGGVFTQENPIQGHQKVRRKKRKQSTKDDSSSAKKVVKKKPSGKLFFTLVVLF